ncbi:ABC transporter permease [Candidatus Dependentiae bacterium]|nr:ABC transporter permease [Candidatus Dependentiae bacterium]
MLVKLTFQFIDSIGAVTLDLLFSLGNFFIFLYKIFKSLFTQKLKIKQLLMQMEKIGVGSFPIIFLTGTGTGFVIALQTYIGFKKFGIQELIGVAVSISMCREIGPVLTALMVTGRSGSSIAAEIGTMQVTEQVDALKTLNIDPYQYLIVPRVLASVLTTPFLTIFSMMCGIIGGYIYCTQVLELNPYEYVNNITQYLTIFDILSGLIKSIFFGFIFSSVATYNGYFAFKGSQQVALAATKTVVTGSILILVTDYILSLILF